MKGLHRRTLSPSPIAAALFLCALAASPGRASQLYGLTEDASIELSGRDAAPLEGTLRLAFAGPCIIFPNEPESCRLAYNYQEHDLSGDGVELSLQPLPAISPAILVIGFASDIELEDGELRLGPVVLEREILAEGERAVGEGFVEFRELRLAPVFDLGGSGYGEVVYEAPTDRFPSAMRLNYVLQEFAATIIHDTNGGADGSLFLPFIEPGSVST